MTPRAPASLPAVSFPAATLVLFRRGAAGGPPELMMLERGAQMRFAAGAIVFPGGRVDPSDHTLAQHVAPDLDPADAAARVAAVRETLEETGLLVGVNEAVTAAIAQAARAALSEQGALAPVLEQFGLTLDLEALVPFARWCPFWDGAFDTRFYLADLGTGSVDIAADGTESARLCWTSAADMLAAIGRGEASALFPTVCNLQRLAQFASFAEARAEAAVIAPELIVPWAESVAGTEYLCIPADRGYPETRRPLAEVRRGRA
ncbi:NUDIX domain-containing protein [Novosphingobium piscinae]|uniref:NUDIX domain-containing protein n=1 Tax=Novosphingobium piscinae TaxID=1507448 RepID=A0A7X1FW68_9SPHN|nr:NUDIX domain-containing protein [Novosphingobium piscinae]MBC2667989.1 NUDIX domain-containing protein [Novosphingobium piscinae]